MSKELTEFEQLKMENFALRQHIMQQQFRQAQEDRKAFIAEIERNHPGFVWNDEQGRLVEAAPQPVAAEEVAS